MAVFLWEFISQAVEASVVMNSNVTNSEASVSIISTQLTDSAPDLYLHPNLTKLNKG
jgi:hypothetical protein